MSIPQSVADILDRHVTFELERIDRMYLNVYVPMLQCESGVAGFFRHHRGHPFASSALMDPMTKAFVASMEHFSKQHEIPVVQFRKGQRKDDVMKEHLRRFDKPEGVVFIGKAQEKTPVFRTEKRRNPETGHTYPWIVRSSAMVNHFYCYCMDQEFGPFFLKFCSYFPYNAKLCLNGHEYAKCQLNKEKIGCGALDNGFVSCEDHDRLQTICDEMGPEQIDALLRRWLARLPHPFTPQDREAGYRYDLSILQAEFSLTQILDRPLSGRMLFEEIIRENLDLGRPDMVQLILSGTTTGVYDPSTGNANGTGRTPFPGNIIPANRLSSITQKLLSLVPAPNYGTPGAIANNYFVETPIINRLHKIDSKMDWNAGSNLRLSGRFGYSPYNITQATVFGPVLGGGNNA